MRRRAVAHGRSSAAQLLGAHWAHEGYEQVACNLTNLMRGTTVGVACQG